MKNGVMFPILAAKQDPKLHSQLGIMAIIMRWGSQLIGIDYAKQVNSLCYWYATEEY